MTSRAHLILVVDDEFTILESLSDVLTHEGYEVISAVNGAKALERMETRTPALMLVDFMMPVLDGVQLVKAVRADARFSAIPIVMMTAAPAGLPKNDHPWDALLVKPFELDRLLATISELIK